MSDLQQPEPQYVPTFCQICGRAVASDADRLEGRAFPCGLCNEVKLAAPASTGSVYPGTPFGGAGAGAAGAPFVGAEAAAGAGGFGTVPPGVAPVGLPPKDAPNPGLAALLGIIPGVGAMYNGQYAKGIVHLIVFAVLCSLSDANGIFGFLAFVWICYQAVEAHQTAKARRDGTPLPNPFGLNDIGERMGFGKAWPSQVPVGGVGAAGPQAAAGAPYPQPGQGSAQAGANWVAPFEAYGSGGTVPPIPPVPPYGAGGPYGQGMPGYPQGQGYPPPYAPVPPFDGEQYVPFNPAMAGFDPIQMQRQQRNRFPAGAIWLIALGTIFLLNTTGIFHGVSFRLSLPLLFLGLGVWSFVSHMTRGGMSLGDDGSPGYRFRLFRAGRGSAWLILLAVIFFLADLHILSWSRSWPLFLILAGVMAFLERAVGPRSAGAMYGYPPPPAAGGSGPASRPVVTSTEITQKAHDDLEGR